MKQFIASITLMLTSTLAVAHPGGHHLECKSAANSGSTQKIEFKLDRSNGTGWFAPDITVTIDGAAHKMTTPDEMKSYGETNHDSPLGVITVSADNSRDKKAAVSGSVSVLAIPATVKAYDTEGNLVQWNIQQEKDECNDSNGKAVFQGIFRGYIIDGKKNINIDTQVLDCELTYDSGMAC